MAPNPTGSPFYLVFAGVNGAGKSTLFRTGMWLHGGLPNALPRVNPDEIIAEMGWDWRNPSDQFKAGHEAAARIGSHLEHRESFNHETTLAGKATLKHLRDAAELGYRTVMFYVGVASPDLANERIAHRGAVGGHLVDAEAVERRFAASLSNLVSAIDVCDEVYLYDNTVLLELEARFAHGELVYANPSCLTLAWVTNTLAALGYEEIRF